MFRSIKIIVFTSILLLDVLRAYSQTNPNPQPVQQIKDTLIPNKLVSVQEDVNNQLGLIYTVKKLDEGKNLVEEGNYLEAEKILLESKSWLTEATEYHYSLYQLYHRQQKNVLLAKMEKAHAADFGHARDQSYFLLAKAYIGENKLKEAVALLVEIIKSQNGTMLSERAYKTLQEIKFSDKAQ